MPWWTVWIRTISWVVHTLEPQEIKIWNTEKNTNHLFPAGVLVCYSLLIVIVYIGIVGSIESDDIPCRCFAGSLASTVSNQPLYSVLRRGLFFSQQLCRVAQERLRISLQSIYLDTLSQGKALLMVNSQSTFLSKAGKKENVKMKRYWQQRTCNCGQWMFLSR